MANIRAELLPQLRGEIIDLGAGTGLSFPYYNAFAHVLAVEPDLSVAARAQQRAFDSDADIDILHANDTALDDLPEQSADHVVAMLVLCSVDEPRSTLQRIQRVLRPGGTYVFVEHVHAEAFAGTIQEALTPLWHRVFGNCHLDRRIEPALRETGFAVFDVTSKRIPFPLQRVSYGIAMRGCSTELRQSSGHPNENRNV